MIQRLLPCTLALCALGSVCLADGPKFDAAQIDFFEKKIRPVLIKHCYKCHSSNADKIKGGLRLDSRAASLIGGDSGPAVVPSKPSESLLLDALKFDGLEMPPQGKLSDNVIADFETWIRRGAADPREANSTITRAGVDYEAGAKFWAFKQPIKHAPPQTKNAGWVRNDIDRFVLARLETGGLSPSRPADRAVLLRRVYFGLIGMPPTIEEVNAFVNDSSSDAFDKVIDRLLQSPHYGERWGRHWLDVARYGEDQAHTFKARKYPRGYFYRDWVVQSFNNDMPYDEFVRSQIAGDLIDVDKRHERIAALGLFALGPVYYAENVEKAKAAADEWDDRIDTLTRGVLGLTVSCARCHDHKYDPISMQDYYGLAGIFANSQYQEVPIVPAEVVNAKRAADDLAKQQQLKIDRFLAAEARNVRQDFVVDIARYMVAAWRIENALRKEKNTKKVYGDVAKKQKLNQELLKRWVAYLKPRRDDSKSRPFLVDWFKLIASQDHKADLSNDMTAVAAVTRTAESFQSFAANKAARKDELFKHFGANAAFVAVADKTEVEPGIIPLGNLFDDSPSVALESALSTDRFGQAASANSLGVDRVAQGWGVRTKIAPAVSFDFGKLGSDKSSYGTIVNDAWQAGASLSTKGRSFSSNKRVEQGIGMHANALVTFDLDEIRKAGLMPPDQKFVFKVDRAGINDDAFGSAASAHVAVIVSKPHKDKAVTDAIIAAFINGQRAEIDVDDFTYYFGGEIPKVLRGDGRFVSFDIPIPADAKHITLVTCGGGPGDGNSINSDHTVFSGARLELDPLPKPTRIADSSKPDDPKTSEQDKADAILLSQLFYDDGLLALPPKEAESRLPETIKKQLADMRKTLETQQSAAGKFKIDMAHALRDSKSEDLPIYLAGNPANHGAKAPRSLPAIFTGGKKSPFDSKGSGRLELAHAITSKDNPLVARVIVNRTWARHFGHGLVRTPSNFGQLGERPTHPELLDHLTVWFVENGWSLKKLHRFILQSATYQQASDYESAKHEADPENRLLWRMNRRRLEIEPWRDAMLAVSGELDRTLGGPSRNLGDANNKRRTLYGFVSRHRLDELLRLFDFPDPNITADRRTTTTVPLQQLFVMNSDFMMQRARALAKRVTDGAGMADEERIKSAYQAVFGRAPRPSELALAIQFLESGAEENGNKINGLEQFALALLSSNEFMFID